MENSSLSHVVIAYDATRELNGHELRLIITEILLRRNILCRGDVLLVLGVLHSVLNPNGLVRYFRGRPNSSPPEYSEEMLLFSSHLHIAVGYQSKACPESFGGTNARALEEEVSKKVDTYVDMLLQSAKQCDEEGVNMKVKISAGTPMKNVIVQEVISCKTTWLILDRHLRWDLKFYMSHIPCKIALIQKSLSVEVLKSYLTKVTDVLEQKPLHSLCKPVLPVSNMEDSLNCERSVISGGSYSTFACSQENSDFQQNKFFSSQSFKSQKDEIFPVSEETGSSSKQEMYGKYSRCEKRNYSDYRVSSNQYDNALHHDCAEKPILCAGCGLRTILYIKESMKFRFSEIQSATSDFSEENLLGEGGYGHVYKGSLRDGQTIAAKLRKEASLQGYIEFSSEIRILSFARHKNIVLLLGYCCEENHNILVYEYICNRSLEWHLFDKSAPTLQWHQRRAIAIGTAKGLRFLHEECRAGPIIHRDLRPSNILLTHDFVPMLGDFGLAKWKTNGDAIRTRVLGTLGYLAPEYAENGVVSVRTDVYAFGVVLLQLISGREVVDLRREGHHQFLLQWAEPLIERLALHELVDTHLGESYDTYELYHMARVAYLCVKRQPEMRPSMGEVVRLLEGDNEHVQELVRQFMPQYGKS